MKAAPEKLIRDFFDYKLSVILYGDTWGGHKATLQCRPVKSFTLSEVEALTLENLPSVVNTGDFCRVLGARIEVFARYADTQDSVPISVWHAAFKLGEIPPSIEIVD